MTYYHGTTERLAQEILREGLTAHREHRFDISYENWNNVRENLRDTASEKESYAYLTKSADIAAEYARTRAIYERAKTGEEWMLPSKIGPGITVRKESASEFDPNARPIVLAVDVPKSIKLEADPNSFSKVFKGRIEPSYIREFLSPLEKVGI